MTPRQVRSIIEEAGATVVEIVRGKHYKAQVKLPDGDIEQFVFACTESDHRAMKNNLARVRRAVRHHTRGAM